MPAEVNMKLATETTSGREKSFESIQRSQTNSKIVKLKLLENIFSKAESKLATLQRNASSDLIPRRPKPLYTE